MKLEDQVVRLELAKKLKELSVNRENLFWWRIYHDDWDGGLHSESLVYGRKTDKYSKKGETEEYEKYISAFTATELGEMLPPGSTSINNANLIHVWNRRRQKYVAALSPHS